MAVQIHLKLDGITGESMKKGFEGQIEILSFSNGAANASSVAFGSGSGAGKVDISSISFQKIIDTATNALFLNCCQGSHIKTGTMTVAEASGGGAQTYFQYDLTEVFIDSISWGAAEGQSSKPSESVSMSAKSIQVSYWPQKTDGTLDAAKVSGWDQKMNSKI